MEPAQRPSAARPCLAACRSGWLAGWLPVWLAGWPAGRLHPCPPPRLNGPVGGLPNCSGHVFAQVASAGEAVTSTAENPGPGPSMKQSARTIGHAPRNPTEKTCSANSNIQPRMGPFANPLAQGRHSISLLPCPLGSLWEHCSHKRDTCELHFVFRTPPFPTPPPQIPAGAAIGLISASVRRLSVQSLPSKQLPAASPATLGGGGRGTVTGGAGGGGGAVGVNGEADRPVGVDGSPGVVADGIVVRATDVRHRRRPAGRAGAADAKKPHRRGRAY